MRKHIISWPLLLGIVCWTLLGSGASAHVAETSEAYLDIGADGITMQLEMPLEQLQLAAPELFVGDPAAQLPGDQARLAGYLREHISLKTPQGERLAFSAGESTLLTHQESPFLVTELSFRSGDSGVPDLLELQLDAILHRVKSHKIEVVLRSDYELGVFAEEPRLLGVVRYKRESVVLDRTHASWWTGFRTMMVNGGLHIAEGTDHLLFLLCLLLPAPLLLGAGCWQGRAGVRASALNVAKIVTAFTLGHSFTLALTALGVFALPSRPVEFIVALSVLVSALHAMRPVFGRHAVVIAVAFGLVHGLAFANEMIGKGFAVDAVLSALVAFNLGVESMQLLVVVAVLPCLLVLAGTPYYTFLRLSFAGFAALAAANWMVERLWDESTTLGHWVEAVAGSAVWGLALVQLFSALVYLSNRLAGRRLVRAA